MDENEITQRLRDAGRQQVPGDVRDHHVTQMHAAVPVVETQKRFGRLAVAAAAFVGFAVGSTGFAMAGALPDPAQQVAHDVLSVVQVEVEDPKANRGQCVSAAARTHGDDELAKQTAKDACPKGKPDHAGKGKPDHAGEGNGKGRSNGGGPPEAIMNDGDECKGPPPWAGKGAKDADKQAFKDVRAACPDDDGDAEADEIEEQQEQEAEAREEQLEAEADALEDQQEQEAEQRQAEAEQRRAEAEALEEPQPEAGGPETQGPPDAVPAPPAPAGPPADAPTPEDTQTDAG